MTNPRPTPEQAESLLTDPDLQRLVQRADERTIGELEMVEELERLLDRHLGGDS